MLDVQAIAKAGVVFETMITDTVKGVAAIATKTKEQIKQNKIELVRGTVVSPENHPSFTAHKEATVAKAENQRDRSIKAANTRYNNRVNAA